MVAQHSDTGAKERVVRVFISSTFRDMREERDRLVKFVFPELRRRFRTRGVQIVDIDLRWGISEEQAKRGETLPVCLAEIERCRPYFIVLLGERYGWVPEELPPSVVLDKPWLATYAGRSVTELEILHGILINPGSKRRAFVYFRDPAYVQALSDAERPAFLPENRGAKEKLTDLKERIRGRCSIRQERYANPRMLADCVLQDFSELLDKEFPVELQSTDNGFTNGPGELDLPEFAGRTSELNRLDDSFATGKMRIAILGGEGSGKSALLGRWAHEIRRRSPDLCAIGVSVGASTESSDHIALGQFLIRRLDSASPALETGPPAEMATFDALSEALRSVARERRVLLVIDAIDQLDDRFVSEQLRWLPRHLPPNVSILVSAGMEFFTGELENRDFDIRKLPSLVPTDRNELIKQYLGNFGKELEHEDINKLASHPCSGQPLFIRAILEALRLRADFASVRERLARYLSASNLRELYVQVLADIDQDLGELRRGLASEAFRFLWAAENGLSETELRELLGAEGEPLPQALWSPLQLVLEGSLVNRGGLLSLKHQSLRNAVHQQYFRQRIAPTEVDRGLASFAAARGVDFDIQFYRSAHVEEERRTRRQLGLFFLRPRPADGTHPTPRALTEGLRQLALARCWTELHKQVGSISLLRTAWPAHSPLLAHVWRELETHSEFKIRRTFAKELDTIGKDAATDAALLGLLRNTGHEYEARLLRPEATSAPVSQDMDASLDSLVDRLLHLAQGCCNDGAYAAAEKHLKEAILLAKETRSTAKIELALGDVALKRGDLAAAEIHAEAAASQSRDYRDFSRLRSSLTLLARIFGQQARPNDVIKTLRERERLPHYQ